MPKEKYQPTPEEARSARDHLTPMQAEATERRESVFNVNETTTGISGGLMKMKESGELKEGPFEEVYEGEINGHKVKLRVGGKRWISSPMGNAYQSSRDTFLAVVDEKEMPPEVSKQIYKKFALDYMSQAKTEEDISRIKEEQAAFQMEEIKKDLGI